LIEFSIENKIPSFFQFNMKNIPNNFTAKYDTRYYSLGINKKFSVTTIFT